MNFFMAHCKDENHKTWGSYNRVTDEKIVNGIILKKRLGNRKCMITFYTQKDICEISLYVKDKANPLAEHKTVTIVIPKEEYESKYLHNNNALREKLELAETFK